MTRNRNPWYSLEKRNVSKIWLKVFGRKGLKFIWNESNCLTLTCLHVFYPSKLGTQYIELLFLYLNTNIAKELFDREKREYGNGLEKFEPNDINKSYSLNFKKLTPKNVERLKRLQEEFLFAHEKKRAMIIEIADKLFSEIYQ